MSQKIKVAVIFGGQSTEHEVSRVSASSVIRNLDTTKYDITKIGITKKGLWNIFNGPVENIENGKWEQEIICSGFGEVEKISKEIDVFFPVLHGMFGEDGSVQALFELLNKPYVGPGILASAVGMDKVYTKQVFEHEGIPQARYLVLKRSAIKESIEKSADNIEKELGYPCFVKPSNSGSSVGISKAHDRVELIEAIRLAASHDRKIVIEEFIEAREIECSVLGNDNPIASVVGEVIPSREFYDYDSKYNDGTSQIIIPAEIKSEISDKIRDYAIKAFIALDCCGMSRVDFFVDKKTEKIYVNEINTIPGFTSISMYPKLIEATGISYPRLLDSLIELALERYKEKNIANG